MLVPLRSISCDAEADPASASELTTTIDSATRRRKRPLLLRSAVTAIHRRSGEELDPILGESLGGLLDSRTDPVVDASGDARLLGVASGHSRRLFVHVEACDPTAVRQREPHRDRRIAGEGPDLEDVSCLREPHEPTEELPLKRPDHHLRDLGDRSGLLLEPAEEVRDRRGVIGGVALHVLVDDVAHSTLPTSTQALCPPRPIAFESATSTSASRASFGT